MYLYKKVILPNMGEAIKLRVYKQNKEGFVPKEWSVQFPNGSVYDPEVKK